MYRRNTTCTKQQNSAVSSSPPRKTSSPNTVATQSNNVTPSSRSSASTTSPITYLRGDTRSLSSIKATTSYGISTGITGITKNRYIICPLVPDKCTETLHLDGTVRPYEAYATPSGRPFLQAQKGSLSGPFTHGIVLTNTTWQIKDWLVQNGAVYDEQQGCWISPIGLDLSLFVKAGVLPTIDIAKQDKKDEETAHNIKEWMKGIKGRFGGQTLTVDPPPSSLSYATASSSTSTGSHHLPGMRANKFKPDNVLSSPFAMSAGMPDEGSLKKASVQEAGDDDFDFSTSSKKELYEEAASINLANSHLKNPPEEIVLLEERAQLSEKQVKDVKSHLEELKRPTSRVKKAAPTKHRSNESAAAMSSSGRKQVKKTRPGGGNIKKGQGLDMAPSSDSGSGGSYESSFVEKDGNNSDQDEAYELSSRSSSSNDSDVEVIQIEGEHQFEDEYGSKCGDDDSFDSYYDDSDSTEEVIPEPKKRKFRATKKEVSKKGSSSNNKKSRKKKQVQVTIKATRPYAVARRPNATGKSRADNQEDSSGSDDDGIIEILSADTPLDAVYSSAQYKKEKKTYKKTKKNTSQDWDVDYLSGEHEGNKSDNEDLD